MNKDIIFIDIDDTLADTRRAVFELYQELTGDLSSDINVKSKRYADFCPLWTNEQITELFNTSDLFKRIKPMPMAKEAVAHLLKQNYDVRIVTLQNADGVPYKHKWIETHFPELSSKVYYVTNVGGNKDVFNGYALIDDDLKNITNNKSDFPILIDIYNIYSDNNQIKYKEKNWESVIKGF